MSEWKMKSDLEEELGKIEESFESSFMYHATPLDDLTTLDENGIEFSIKEMMELNDLNDEY